MESREKKRSMQSRGGHLKINKDIKSCKLYLSSQEIRPSQGKIMRVKVIFYAPILIKENTGNY